MLTLVTRPAAQAGEWVRQLQAHGIAAAALPLIGIAPVDDAAPLVAAWHGLALQRLVVFVSPNAAQHFFAARPVNASWPVATLAGSPGPGTTRALLDAGVPADAIVEPALDALQFDSEALWARLAAHEWSGRAVLLIRGDAGREWLADRLRERGASITALTAYRRGPPQFDAAERALLDQALREPAAVLWFFSSSEAIDHLEAICASRLDSPPLRWAQTRALATHPRIASRARRLGIERVLESRPTPAAVAACIAACVQRSEDGCIQSPRP